MQHGSIQGYGVCTQPHPPTDVEKHARERLMELERDIPSLTQRLAEMATEKRRLEKMLKAIDGLDGLEAK